MIPFSIPRRAQTPKLSTIKTQIDNKFSLLYRMLNHVPISTHNRTPMEDKNCQTDYDIEAGVHQKLDVELLSVGSVNKGNRFDRTQHSTELRSNSSTSRQIFDEGLSIKRISHGLSAKTGHKIRNANKSLEMEFTPKKQRNKINHKNDSFQKILKQRKRLNESRRLQRQQAPIKLRTDTLSKICKQIDSKVKMPRNQTQEGGQLRKKLIQKISDLFYQF